ncbi:hypothetical protein PG984_006646 [Apiospora sp. TS-2023a]
MQNEVQVVLGRAMLGDPPLVGEGVAGYGRALGDGSHVIIAVGHVLADSVKTDSCVPQMLDTLERKKITRLAQMEKTSLPSKIVIMMIMRIIEYGVTCGTPS